MENIAEQKYFTESRPELLKYVPSRINTMLDVGCASGNYSALVKSKFKDVEIWGLEINAAAAEVAKTRIDRVLVGDLRESMAKLPERYFDYIAFNDILEHLIDPWQVLKNIRKNLAENGVIIASIPNFLEQTNVRNLLIGQEWEYKDMGTLDRTHLRFFTRKSIIRMFEECGYVVMRIEGINPTSGRKWRVLNDLTFGFWEDTKYMQFVCVAKPL